MKNKKQFNELLKRIKEETDHKYIDAELTHVLYDEAIKILAQDNHKTLVKKLDRLVKDVGFWYA